ncbi:THIF-type NAD/FAD binding fold-containing protein [Desulfonema magnum]|uniref:THIF-type NAD/FAD binding fold-containing protein n=2 Tax=Desulfonema magnum TaxID=45655 RepID=A0A975BVJ1_9BACT|nr:THIF-type NAD/FAD binding fold-containing protein [Desulfonema magnum]
MTILSSEELTRYNRQIIIPEIGEQGQKKLRQAKVFIAGMGGLGSVSAYYMAAAGIGTLKIADMDHVLLGNLNRQILYGINDIKRPKTESALEKLRELNPFCHILPVQEEICDENVMDMVADCEIILDATDNPETRKVLNRASVSKKIPFVYGGVNGFSGMVTTFVPGETPCFECLFPQNSLKKGEIPSLGPVVGIVASIQSLEVIKIILGIGSPLKCKLLYIEGLDMTFKEIRVKRNPNCKVCQKLET